MKNVRGRRAGATRRVAVLATVAILSAGAGRVDPGSLLLGAAALAAVTPPAFSSTVPAGSGIQVIGVHPEPRLAPRPLVAHFPLANFLSFELDFSTPSMALTFESATVRYYDENGQVYRQDSFGVAELDQYAFRFDSNPLGSGANIPIGERIILPFPLENLAHNEVPQWLDVALCFAEFADANGDCVDPLLFENIPLYEYRSPGGQTYIYPTQAPAGAGEIWSSGGAYELTKPNGHRRGGLRLNGPTAWVNQRYAWDIGVIRGSGGPDCDDGNGNTGDACDELDDYFCWGEPVLAPADGEVVLITQGNPDNAEPRCVGRQDCSACTSYNPTEPPLCDLAPGAATCNGLPDVGLCSATTDPCPPGAFPGSGNQIVLFHDNGQYTTFAHLMEGSNDHLSCGDRVERGEPIGLMGMSGSGSNPHLHFSALFTPGPEAQVAEAPPMYFNNVEFLTPGATRPRRQLDTGIPTDTELTAILPPPAPLPANPPQSSGSVNEQEPNDTLPTHDAVNLPTAIGGSVETGEVGDLAIRGDGIEDIFRFDLGAADSVRVDLAWSDGTRNLDVYALDEELRVLNDTRQGTGWQPGTSERVCLDLGPGAHYLAVTNTDQSPANATAYTLSIESDPATIACTVTNATDPIAVDESCAAEVSFEIAIHDTCCLDEETLNLDVQAKNPTDNLTVGEVTIDSIQFPTERDAVVKGRVAVSGVTSCPAEVEIEATAFDCRGDVVATTSAGTGCTAEVIDDLPPSVVSDVDVDLLWPPNHDLVSVGFAREAADNCDADVAQSLMTHVWSDEAETAPKGPRFSPDAQDANGDLHLRRERDAKANGRVYLMVSDAADSCGNEASSCAVSGIPHDQKRASIDALEDQMDAAQAVCDSTGAPPTGFSPQGGGPLLGPKQ